MAQHLDLIPDFPTAGIGLDIGSTLVKVARAGDGGVHCDLVAVSEQARVLADLPNAGAALVAVTGAGAAGWAGVLAPWQPRAVSEFDATAAGARTLLRRDGGEPDGDYLVVSVGTGTSVLLVSPQGVERVGGTALGGGTLLGLGRLLCGTGDYAELARLAVAGNRREVDLLVGDVYPEGVEDVFRDLTAANFGRVRSQDPGDLAQAICGLLGENLGLLCGALARVHGASQVLYCGATLLDSPALTGVLLGTTAYAGAPAVVLGDGAYCGALGALASLACPPTGAA